MKKLLWAALLVGLTATGVRADDKESAKEGLKELHEFIGGWKGSSRIGKVETENFEWSWNFKGDVSLVLKADKGKFLKEGVLKFVPSKKLYVLTLTDAKGSKRDFEGTFEDNNLRLERTDPGTKEVQKLTMNTFAEGVRFAYVYERKPEGRTQFIKDYSVAATKLGESLGKTEKKPECVVSGGVGTMAVTYKGETFYVCCSGCRDEFNSNPEKYVKEFKAKKNK